MISFYFRGSHVRRLWFLPLGFRAFWEVLETLSAAGLNASSDAPLQGLDSLTVLHLVQTLRHATRREVPRQRQLEEGSALWEELSRLQA